MRMAGVVLAAMALPIGAMAQAPRPVHEELPSAEQPVRQVPTTGYTLALSWTPEYCHSRRGGAGGGVDPECANRRQASGFTLHGLWPDGNGPNRWPQYCHPVAMLTDAQTRDALAVTPSRQLLQHEWAKHGSCMGADPVRYFAEEDRLFRTVSLPDMGALARRRDLTAGDVAEAFAAANTGLPAGAIRINANRRGWMEEVWICLGLDRRPRPCAASQGGAAPGATLRIETGGRADAGGYNRSYGDRPYRRPIERPS